MIQITVQVIIEDTGGTDERNTDITVSSCVSNPARLPEMAADAAAQALASHAARRGPEWKSPNDFSDLPDPMKSQS